MNIRIVKDNKIGIRNWCDKAQDRQEWSRLLSESKTQQWVVAPMTCQTIWPRGWASTSPVTK